MNVRELKAELSKYPDNLTVSVGVRYDNGAGIACADAQSITYVVSPEQGNYLEIFGNEGY